MRRELSDVNKQALEIHLKKNWNNFFLKYAQWQCILSFNWNSTAMYLDLKTIHPGGIRTRGIFRSGGGSDHHYATSPDS
jgi:hypothetical protein